MPSPESVGETPASVPTAPPSFPPAPSKPGSTTEAASATALASPCTGTVPPSPTDRAPSSKPPPRDEPEGHEPLVSHALRLVRRSARLPSLLLLAGLELDGIDDIHHPAVGPGKVSLANAPTTHATTCASARSSADAPDGTASAEAIRPSRPMTKWTRTCPPRLGSRSSPRS